MRAEVKIGIIIGLVVFGGGLVFFLSQGKKAGKDVVDNVPLNKPATTADTKDKPGGAAQLPGARHTPSKPAGTDRTQATANRPGTEPGTAPKTTPTTPPKVTPAPGTPGSTRPAGTPATGTLPPRTDRSADSTPRPLTGEPWPTPTPASRPLSVPPAAGPTTQPAEPLPGPSHGAPGVAVPPSPATEPPPPAATPTFPPDRTTPTTAAKKHTVAKGETLSVIAEQYYGDKNLWPKIKAANPAIDPDRLLVGQVLVIPANEELVVARETLRCLAARN